jgi:hypothetical protein
MLFKKRWDTKAQISDMAIRVIVDLIIILFITTVLLLYIMDSVNDKRFEKQFLARDISLLTDAVYASPYDLVVSYSSKNPEFSYNPLIKGGYVNPGYTYDFTVYRVDIYTQQYTPKTEEEKKQFALLSLLAIYTRSTDYTKGTYHIASDKKIINEPAKIQADEFNIIKEDEFLKTK